MECGDTHEGSLTPRKDNRQIHATRGSRQTHGSFGTGEIILSIEKSVILLLHILKMCIRRRRLRFDEKLFALQSLAWIISHTDFEGLVPIQTTIPSSKTNLLTDSGEESTAEY